MAVSCPCTGVLPSPCFPIFLARTTFVLVSLSEVKIPCKDAIFGDFVFNSSTMEERGGRERRWMKQCFIETPMK